MSIILEPVTIQNGWTLIFYNNTLGIYKGNYYYSTESPYHFKIPPIYQNITGFIYLGVYKPVIADTNYLCSIQIVINNHNFMVNTLTRIVYIKPSNIVIVIPGNLPYNYELYSTYTFAGIYDPYMNSNSTSGKSFINMIPNTTIKPPKIESTQVQYSSPIENTLTDNPYPKRDCSIDVIKGNIITAVNDLITFIIPFNNTNNINLLEKTVNSIIKYVKNNRIIVVGPKELPNSIKDHVMFLHYTRYVGKPGYENRLNVIMGNGYDIGSFYNYLITNYVKTYLYTIWNYNWEIESWTSSIATNKIFIVPNYYTYNNSIYKSLKTFTTGYILINNKTRYTNTVDMFGITLNGLGVKEIDNNIIIKGNYTEVELNEKKGLLLYGNDLEVRDFYLNISKGIKVDYVEKII